MIVNYEYESMWKVAIMSCLKLCHGILQKGSQKTSAMIIWCPGQDSSSARP
jgi:hypothetical protein